VRPLSLARAIPSCTDFSPAETPAAQLACPRLRRKRGVPGEDPIDLSREENVSRSPAPEANEKLQRTDCNGRKRPFESRGRPDTWPIGKSGTSKLPMTTMSRHESAGRCCAHVFGALPWSRSTSVVSERALLSGARALVLAPSANAGLESAGLSAPRAVPARLTTLPGLRVRPRCGRPPLDKLVAHSCSGFFVASGPFKNPTDSRHSAGQTARSQTPVTAFCVRIRWRPYTACSGGDSSAWRNRCGSRSSA
jgi:hypothetical protein